MQASCLLGEGNLLAPVPSVYLAKAVSATSDACLTTFVISFTAMLQLRDLDIASSKYVLTMVKCFKKVKTYLYRTLPQCIQVYICT